MSELFKDLKHEDSIFLNPQMLDFDYQPKLIPYREEQQHHIARCIKPILNKRNGTNLVIVGGPGVGKTVCLKHVLQELKDEFPNEVYCLYINCWKTNTSHKIAVSLCHQLDYKFTHNKSYDELMQELCELINEKSAVIVMDEVDKLDDNNLLYTLLEDLFRKCLILITNEREFLALLDSRIKSRLIPNTLEFNPYNLEQTKGILNERLQYAFVKNSMDKNAFDIIINKTYDLKDIRTGLFLIREAGEIAETKLSKIILPEYAEESIKKLNEFKKRNGGDLEDSYKDIIEIVKNNSGKTTKDLFKIYNNLEGKSYRTFQRKIRSLHNAGLISVKEENKGFDGGRSMIVEYNTKLDDF